MTVCASYRWIEKSLYGALLLMCSAYAKAQPLENAWETFQVHGFLSQALVVSSANDFFGPSSSSGGSLEFYELGLNASMRPTDNLLMSAQVLSRRAGGDASDASPKLDYGLIDYQIHSDVDETFGIKVGRVKNPFGFYNQTRDVPFTRPSILLPQSIYFDRTRAQSLSGDGVVGYFDHRFDDSSIRFQLGWGVPQVDDDVEDTVLMDILPGSLEAEPSLISQLLYEYDGGRFVAALTYADVKADYKSSVDAIGDGRFSYTPIVLSLQYNSLNWSLTSEYAYRDRKLSHMGNDLFNVNTIGESWYVQYVYRFNSDWQGLLRYDVMISDRDDPDGHAFEAAGFGKSYSRYAYDRTVGVQWSATSQFLLSAEYHNVEGTGWLLNAERESESKYWGLFLLQASYRF
ncbi:hypothetical protein [Larsenimonas suaedae]|uniref:Porin n=1 Tax=Larsenimonas suaedae TaxID=1851019 RepID=A0ABU1GTQ0_9GAMM|nr:hypothetical protein [Larsenimonas suaedae]MCM2972268.1 hypothetical protein [Larsenimonas suaedae]MDR5894936.1 hypothetical protein [Larsenimonas suaedae]